MIILIWVFMDLLNATFVVEDCEHYEADKEKCQEL